MTPNDIITWLRDKLPYAPDHAWKNVMEATIPLLGELESRRRHGAIAVINEEENERLKDRISRLEAELSAARAERDVVTKRMVELEQVHSGRITPRSPHPDYNIMACPRCGSGEYLHNHDGNEMPFCGQCGQAISWEDL